MGCDYYLMQNTYIKITNKDGDSILEFEKFKILERLYINYAFTYEYYEDSDVEIEVIYTKNKKWVCDFNQAKIKQFVSELGISFDEVTEVYNEVYITPRK